MDVAEVGFFHRLQPQGKIQHDGAEGSNVVSLCFVETLTQWRDDSRLLWQVHR